MDQPVAAAPAPPETITATRDAANRGDFNAFDKADHAARVGKPLSEVAAPPAKPVAATPPAADAPIVPPAAAASVTEETRQLSKRQQETNDRIRDAVDRATADLRAEVAQLRRAPARTEQPAAPAPTKEADHKRYLAMPDAPKLDQFDSIEEHSAAMAVFVADKRHEERETARVQQTREHDSATAHETRLATFHERTAAAAAKDPAFYERVKPISSQLTPTANAQAINAAISRGEITGQPIAIGPMQSLADEILDSESSAALLDHFQAHPDEFDKFKTLRSPREVTRELAKIEARLTPATAAAPPAPPVPKKFISDAPPPPPIISTPHTSADPQASALARGDFAAFDKLEQQKRIAKLQPAASRG